MHFMRQKSLYQVAWMLYCIHEGIFPCSSGAHAKGFDGYLILYFSLTDTEFNTISAYLQLP